MTVPTSALAPELERVAVDLRKIGVGGEDCARAARAVNQYPETHGRIMAWKHELQIDDDRLERVVLYFAIQKSLPRLPTLPVHESVKGLLQKEFNTFLKVPSNYPVLAGTDPFTTACKIATLQRFPAGPMDWVVSGLPLAWLKGIETNRLGPALWHILRRFGGRKPFFYIHLAHPPRNRSLVIQNEVRKAYYRMAASLKLQPGIKGIMTAAWFHDPQALQDTPHLSFLNEPYLQLGGKIVAAIGPAPVDSGFLKFNPQRRKDYEEGKVHYHLTLAMWPRKAAIFWAEQHPELG